MQQLYSDERFSNVIQVIPIELCKWAYQNRKVNQLHTWIILKMHFKGDFSRSEAFSLFERYKSLRKDKKTIRAHIRTLEGLKFLRDWGKHPKGYIASGYSYIHKLLSFQGKTSAVLYPDDLPKFRAFIASAIIGYHSNRFKSNSTGETGARPKGARNSTGLPLFESGLSVNLIAETLNVSKGRAAKIKQECVRANYLNIEHQYLPLEIEGYEATKTNLTWIREMEGYKMQIRNGQWYEQIHDSIIPLIDYKKKRVKKETINGGLKGERVWG